MERKANDVVTTVDQNRSMLVAGLALVGVLLLNHKVNKEHALNQANLKTATQILNNQEGRIAALESYAEVNLKNVFRNFKMIQKDINNLATHAGFQGKLKVNS